MFIQSLSHIINFVSSVTPSNGGDQAVDPLYNAISTIGPYAIGVVLLLWVIYGIILGVKFAKAEDSKEKAALQKALVNGCIGFLAILVLVVIVYAIRGPLVEYMNS